LPPLPYPFGTPFVSLSSVDSTNDEARRYIQAGIAVPGMAIFTADQQKGKGQRGKTWEAAKDQSLALSILIKPDFLTVQQQFLLSALIALGTRAWLATQVATDQFRIKWPNDLYWNHQKIGGILIENIVTSGGEWNWAIVGIGINLNQDQFPSDLPNPVSLFQLNGKKSEPATAAKSLCASLSDFFQSAMNKDEQKILEQYQQFLYGSGELCSFSRAGVSFQAIPLGVTPQGELLLDRIEKPIQHGELEWKIKTV
jgi:BirA family biotin operon repressor/biotin-[acetyl-CoA-carboxylase] ligase